MTDFEVWERQLQQELDDIRRNGRKIAAAIAAVRGRGEVPGVLVEVDAHGDITTLTIAPAAMRWRSTTLTDTLLACHRKARAAARTKAEQVVRAADPRIRNQIQQGRSTAAHLNADDPADR